MFDSIMKILWNENTHLMSIGYLEWFSQLADQNEKGWYRPCDGNGLPFYLFNRSGFDSHMVTRDGARVD
jgi:hypothetical protein